MNIQEQLQPALEGIKSRSNQGLDAATKLNEIAAHLSNIPVPEPLKPQVDNLIARLQGEASAITTAASNAKTIGEEMQELFNQNQPNA
jgi:hypothetical protein